MKLTFQLNPSTAKFVAAEFTSQYITRPSSSHQKKEPASVPRFHVWIWFRQKELSCVNKNTYVIFIATRHS